MKKLLLIALAVILFSCSKDEPDNKYTPEGHRIGIVYECDSDDVEYFCISDEELEHVQYLINISGMDCISLRFRDLLGEEIVGKFSGLILNSCRGVVYTK